MNSVEVEQGGDSLTVMALQGAFGSVVRPNLALEGRLSFGIDDDAESGVTLEQGIGLEAYVKPFVSLSDAVTGYGLVGFVFNNFELSSGGASADDDLSSISFGLGLDFALKEGLGVNVEYHTFSDDATINGTKIPDLDVNTISVGLRMEL